MRILIQLTYKIQRIIFMDATISKISAINTENFIIKTVPSYFVETKVS